MEEETRRARPRVWYNKVTGSTVDVYPDLPAPLYTVDDQVTGPVNPDLCVCAVCAVCRVCVCAVLLCVCAVLRVCVRVWCRQCGPHHLGFVAQRDAIRAGCRPSR